jgi:hypothetical protein
MPIVAVIKLKADTQSLLSTLDRLRPDQVRSGPTPGLILHTVSPSHDGVLIVDVWESAAHYWSFLAGAKARRSTEVTGLPGPEIQIFEVHAMLHPAEGWPSVGPGEAGDAARGSPEG